jgi:hypothetical protein
MSAPVPQHPDLLGPLDAFRVEAPPAGSCRSVLLKGASGSGKTHFALDETAGPVLIVYQDNNRMTLEHFLSRRSDLYELHFDTWAEFSDVLVPRVRTRLVDVTSIIVDTGDMLQAMMWREIQGAKSRLTTPDFGTGLSRLSSTFTDLTNACRPLPPQAGRTYAPEGHPGYNLIVCWHLSDVTNEQGALLRTTPRVLGQFKDHVEDLFDLVLLMDASLVGEVQEIDGRKLMVNRKECFARTVPPTEYHTTKAPLHWPEKIRSYKELAALIEAESQKEHTQ